jgi:hypothetical protein
MVHSIFLTNQTLDLLSWMILMHSLFAHCFALPMHTMGECVSASFCQPRFCHIDSTVPATVCLHMCLLPYLFGIVM